MEALTHYWQQIVFALGLVIWSIRLEGKVKTNASEIDRLERLRQADLTDAKESRRETNAKLDKMDEKIERAFLEVRSDIKALLRQAGGAE